MQNKGSECGLMGRSGDVMGRETAVTPPDCILLPHSDLGASAGSLPRAAPEVAESPSMSVASGDRSPELWQHPSRQHQD